MKCRSLFLLLLVAISSATAKAQFQPIAPEVFLGVSGGVTLSNTGFSPSIAQSMKMGASGGLVFRYIAERYAGLILELNYSQAGWKDDFKGGMINGVPLSYQRTLSYIEFPAMAHIYFGKSNFRYFINLGPKIGYMISESTACNFTQADKITNPNGSGDHYFMPVQNRFDYGLTGGMGFELRTKAGCFLIEGRYYFGLGDIYNNATKDPFVASSNQVISANLKYLIQINKKR